MKLAKCFPVSGVYLHVWNRMRIYWPKTNVQPFLPQLGDSNENKLKWRRWVINCWKVAPFPNWTQFECVSNLVCACHYTLGYLKCRLWHRTTKKHIICDKYQCFAFETMAIFDVKPTLTYAIAHGTTATATRKKRYFGEYIDNLNTHMASQQQFNVCSIDIPDLASAHLIPFSVLFFTNNINLRQPKKASNFRT